MRLSRTHTGVMNGLFMVGARQFLGTMRCAWKVNLCPRCCNSGRPGRSGEEPGRSGDGQWAHRAGSLRRGPLGRRLLWLRRLTASPVFVTGSGGGRSGLPSSLASSSGWARWFARWTAGAPRSGYARGHPTVVAGDSDPVLAGGAGDHRRRHTVSHAIHSGQDGSGHSAKDPRQLSTMTSAGGFRVLPPYAPRDGYGGRVHVIRYPGIDT